MICTSMSQNRIVLNKYNLMRKSYLEIVHANIQDPIRGCEVGVFDGVLSNMLLSRFSNLHLYMVDCYMKASYRYTLEVMSEAMKTAHLNTAKFVNRATMLIGYSHQVVGLIPDRSLDFVYIDANHMKSQVARDIKCWYPKVRRGGLVSGHDYDVKRGKYKGVVLAVDKFARDNDYTVHINDTNWWFTKH